MRDYNHTHILQSNTLHTVQHLLINMTSTYFTLTQQDASVSEQLNGMWNGFFRTTRYWTRINMDHILCEGDKLYQNIDVEDKLLLPSDLPTLCLTKYFMSPEAKKLLDHL